MLAAQKRLTIIYIEGCDLNEINFFNLLLILIPNVSANLTTFLEEDKTNEHEYLPYYTCGHFSRDLAKNASECNLTIGSAILGNHPRFKGYNNHIVNYIMDNNIIVIIEPQTDNILYLNQTGYKYYRLYTDGTQVPTYWKNNLAYTGVIK